MPNSLVASTACNRYRSAGIRVRERIETFFEEPDSSLKRFGRHPRSGVGGLVVAFAEAGFACQQAAAMAVRAKSSPLNSRGSANALASA